MDRQCHLTSGVKRDNRFNATFKPSPLRRGNYCLTWILTLLYSSLFSFYTQHSFPIGIGPVVTFWIFYLRRSKRLFGTSDIKWREQGSNQDGHHPKAIVLDRPPT
jgi:hypothetical protein